MSETDLFIYDVRVRGHLLADGSVTESELNKRRAALPDLEGQCVDLELEQPALAREPEPPPPAPVIVQPQSETFSAHNKPAPPDFSRSSVASASDEPIPAIQQEGASPASGPPASSPQSIPPPTASVDADWGDS